MRDWAKANNVLFHIPRAKAQGNKAKAQGNKAKA
jgi:hypothetical protein